MSARHQVPAGLRRHFSDSGLPDSGLPDFPAGLARGALHEVCAAEVGDAPAALGFAAVLAGQAACGRPVAWIRPDRAERLYAPGLAGLGLDPAGFLLVQGRDATAVLRAALDVARCPAVGAAVIEIWGASRVLDLTATRRLSLAAAQSGVTLLLARVTDRVGASTAMTRWMVRANASLPWEGDTPGLPGFDVTLQRHRGAMPGRSWQVEWDHDRHRFRTVVQPVSRVIPAFPAGRAPLAEEARYRCAG